MGQRKSEIAVADAASGDGNERWSGRGVRSTARSTSFPSGRNNASGGASPLASRLSM